MSTSTLPARLLAPLQARARLLGWSDAEWARRADVPKETLSRLRSRDSCDLATLDALARAVGATLGVELEGSRRERRVPRSLDRAAEARLLDLLARRTCDVDEWRMAGPSFFMAGLAVTLASSRGFDRARHLALAEALVPGSTEPDVYRRWLAETPLRPSRLFPMLEQGDRAA